MPGEYEVNTTNLIDMNTPIDIIFENGAPTDDIQLGLDSVDETIERVVRDAINETVDSNLDQTQPTAWKEVSGKFLKTFQCSENNPGNSQDVVDNLTGKGPAEVYKHFLKDEVLQLIVDQTNLYAQQTIAKGITRQSRLQR